MKSLFMPLLRRLPRRWSAFLLFGILLTVSSCGAPIAGESWAGITIDKDGKYAYVAYKEQVFKLDLAPLPNTPITSRYMVWRTTLPSNTHTYTPPAFSPDGSTLYVGAFDHKVYALDAAGGKLNDKFNPAASEEHLLGTPLVIGKTVVVGMGSKGVRTYDAATGADLAYFDGTQFGVWSTPILDPDGKTVYVASLDHYVYALDLSNNLKMLWKVDVGGAVAGTPFYYDKVLYVGTFGNQLEAVSTDSHEVISRYSTRGWVWSTPYLYTQDKTLLFGDLNGWVYALDISDIRGAGFKLKWEATDNDHPGAIRGSVVVAKNVVNGANGSNPVDEVIVGSESHYLRAYNADNGQVIWTAGISTEDKILSDLTLVGNDVIFTTLSENQIVKAFDIHNGQPSWDVKLSDAVNFLATQTMQPATQVPQATQTPKVIIVTATPTP